MTDLNEPSISVEESTSTASTEAGGPGSGNLSGKEDRLRAFAHKVFSFPALLGALLITAIMLATRANLPDPDTWWHLAVGQQILATHHWPTREIFSFTAYGDAWIAFEWLGEVLMAFVERLGGLEALQALLFALSGLLALLVYYYAYLRSRNWKAAFVACFLTLPLATGFFTLRPQIMGYLCLLAVLICLEKYRQGNTRALWALPLILLVWVNTHGSFVLGLLALAIFWASGLGDLQVGGIRAERWNKRQRITLEAVAMVSGLVMVVTPYGSQLGAYPLEMILFQPLVPSKISEWQPIGFGEVWGKEVFLLLFLFFLANLIFRPRYHLAELLLLLLAVYLACVHRRFFPFAAIIMAPMLATLLSRWIPGYSRRSDHYVLNAVLIAAFVLGTVNFFPSHRDLEKVITRLYPQGSLNYLARHPQPGHMFNDYVWGGYLIWKRGPQHKVFIDGRADVYEYAGVFGDYLHMVHVNPDTLFLLRKYSIRSCLLTRDDPLGTLLTALPNWRRAYEDDTSVLYFRRSNASTPNGTQPDASDSQRKSVAPQAVNLHTKLKSAEEQ